MELGIISLFTMQIVFAKNGKAKMNVTAKI